MMIESVTEKVKQKWYVIGQEEGYKRARELNFEKGSAERIKKAKKHADDWNG